MQRRRPEGTRCIDARRTGAPEVFDATFARPCANFRMEGRALRADLAAVPWRERSEALWPYARDALHALRADHDVVVIEGADQKTVPEIVAEIDALVALALDVPLVPIIEPASPAPPSVMATAEVVARSRSI